MQLSIQNLTNLVQGMAATVQASAAQVLDLSVGSTLRAVLESSASVGLWMQWLILQVLQMTRAATSDGADLDSWMADFSLTRLPATPASGMVSFSRYVGAGSAVVPIGSLVRTSDSRQIFTVIADPANSAWDQDLNGYLLGNGICTLDVPVSAQIAGAQGNVQANTVVLLGSAIAGIDSVTNAAPFQNGMDAESDSAFRLRFQGFMASLSRATISAVSNAVAGVQQGISYTIRENQNAAGASQPGSFVIVADDGTGYPPESFISAVQAAVDAVRPVGSVFAIFPPVPVQVNVSVSLLTSPTCSKASVVILVANAITSYIDSLTVGTSLPASRIVQVTYAASTDVLNVTQVTLNGSPEDISAQANEVLKSGTVVVT